MRTRFPDRTMGDLTFPMAQDNFIAFAYLFKKFLWKTAFAVDGGFKFKGQYVEAFRASKSKMKTQLYYKYYNDKTDFMMGI